MKRIVVLLMFNLGLLACQKKADLALGQIAIRITNNSDYQFEEVYVKALDDEHQYGTLEPGASSEYKPFTIAYKYAYLKLKIKGEEFILQPFDYTGEEKLAKGKYTYMVSVHDYQNKRLIMNCKRD